MGKHSVITDYSRMPDGELSILAQWVYTCLNPNPNFKWDEAFMPQFKVKIDLFQSLLAKSLDGTSADVLEKNEAKTVVANDLHFIGVNVNLQGGNNLVILQSSGLRLAKQRSKRGQLPKPTNFKVTTGSNSGSLLFLVEPCSDCNVYLFFSAPVPAPATIEEMRETVSTNHKMEILGFIPGVQYKCVSAYKGSDLVLVYSDPVFIYAQ